MGKGGEPSVMADAPPYDKGYFLPPVALSAFQREVGLAAR